MPRGSFFSKHLRTFTVFATKLTIFLIKPDIFMTHLDFDAIIIDVLFQF